MEWIKLVITVIVLGVLAVSAWNVLFAGMFNRGNDMYVIVGLGNPGNEYEKTKHNTGFRVIDKIADKYNIDICKFKHKAMVGDGMINGQKVMLVKPQTYMNLSGESVREVMSFYKVPIENMIVVFDDISLAPGFIRIREKGSAGGHNGIKNIIAHMGTENFSRIKVGIGEKPSGWDLADYVLAKFTEDEEASLALGIDHAVSAAELFIKGDLQTAMNRFNKKNKPPKEKKEKKENTENKTETKSETDAEK